MSDNTTPSPPTPTPPTPSAPPPKTRWIHRLLSPLGVYKNTFLTVVGVVCVGVLLLVALNVAGKVYRFWEWFIGLFGLGSYGVVRYLSKHRKEQSQRSQVDAQDEADHQRTLSEIQVSQEAQNHNHEQVLKDIEDRKQDQDQQTDRGEVKDVEKDLSGTDDDRNVALGSLAEDFRRRAKEKANDS